ncbi:hypothetical protein ACFYOT_31640 [Saccharothrix saharensis]|uniref:hypothetical protein n=1 Tax=Saccharothrix saharensis TaxID=571190 RepID=UPI0036BEA1EB
MTVPKSVPEADDLDSTAVLPAVGPEELTQGHGLTELGASSGGLCLGPDDCDDHCGGCAAVA